MLLFAVFPFGEGLGGGTKAAARGLHQLVLHVDGETPHQLGDDLLFLLVRADIAAQQRRLRFR